MVQEQEQKPKNLWDGTPCPANMCGGHFYEQTSVGGGKNHVCQEKPGHKGHCKCHCGVVFVKDTERRRGWVVPPVGE